VFDSAVFDSAVFDNAMFDNAMWTSAWVQSPSGLPPTENDHDEQ
jgi:hypothetical protein